MRLLLSAALGVAILACTQVHAEETFPNKPIKVVVPNPAGGATDIVSRVVAKTFGEKINQSAVIVNIAGGGTAIGAQEVARSPADGYTILSTHSALLTSSALGINKLGMDSLVPVAQVGRESFLVAVPQDSPIKTLSDFYEAARPGSAKRLKLGANLTAANHFAFLEILQPVQSDVTFVPVAGGAPALKALLGGHVDAASFAVSESLDQIRAGSIRAIALFAPSRHPAIPDVPTAHDAGYNLDVGLHYVWYAPVSTPPERVKVLADAMEQVLGDSAAQRMLVEHAVQPEFMRGTELVKATKERYQRIKSIAEKIKAEKK